jgi:hypothetical protein
LAFFIPQLNDKSFKYGIIPFQVNVVLSESDFGDTQVERDEKTGNCGNFWLTHNGWYAILHQNKTPLFTAAGSGPQGAGENQHPLSMCVKQRKDKACQVFSENAHLEIALSPTLKL